MQCGVGTIKNLDSQLKGAKTKNRRLSKKLTKISAFAKEKQETLKQRETGGGGAGGAMAGTSEAGAQQTEMRELLEELQRTQEDVLALSSICVANALSWNREKPVQLDPSMKRSK